MLHMPLTLLKQLLKKKARPPEVIYDIVSWPPRYQPHQFLFQWSSAESLEI